MARTSAFRKRAKIRRYFPVQLGKAYFCSGSHGHGSRFQLGHVVLQAHRVLEANAVLGSPSISAPPVDGARCPVDLCRT